MENKNRNKEDLLRDYFDTEYIEKAPDGFTSRVMETVRISPATVKTRGWLSRYSIPLVSALVTVAFILVALIMPQSIYGTSPLKNIVEKITIEDLSIDPGLFSGISVPSWIPYMLIAILSLVVIDRIMSGFLQKD